MNYSVHQCPFAEAISRSAKVDVSRPNVRGIFVSFSPVMQLNSEQILTLHCFKIYFNVVLPSILNFAKAPLSIKFELSRLTSYCTLKLLKVNIIGG
jgi:hypothetical protein